jgi:hypothetical protein
VGSFIFQLRSFAIFSLAGLTSSPLLATGVFPHSAEGPPLVSLGRETGPGGSSSGIPGAGATAQPTENWYQFFCGPGWDPAVIVQCGIHGDGSPYHGCGNSADAHGGRLIVDSGDAAADDVVLYAFGERPGALSIILQGPSKTAGGLPFGEGVRCVSGSLKRLYSRIATGGVVIAPLSGEPSIRTRSAELGAPIPSPATRYYQVWYRDGVGHFNITSALQIDWP